MKLNKPFNEEGSILVTAMLLMLVLTVFAMTAVTMAYSDFHLAIGQGTESQARALAEAGVSEVMKNLHDGVDLALGDTSGDSSEPKVSLGEGTYQYEVVSKETVGPTTIYTISSTGILKNRLVKNEVEIQKVEDSAIREYSVMAGTDVIADSGSTSNGNGHGYGYGSDDKITFRDGKYYAGSSIELSGNLKFKDSEFVAPKVTIDSSSHGEGNKKVTINTSDTQIVPEVNIDDVRTRFDSDDILYDTGDIIINKVVDQSIIISDKNITVSGVNLKGKNEPYILLAKGDISIESGTNMVGFVYAEGDVLINGDASKQTVIKGIIISQGNVSISGKVMLTDDDGSDKGNNDEQGQDEDKGKGKGKDEDLEKVYDLIINHFDVTITSWKED